MAEDTLAQVGASELGRIQPSGDSDQPHHPFDVCVRVSRERPTCAGHRSRLIATLLCDPQTRHHSVWRHRLCQTAPGVRRSASWCLTHTRPRGNSPHRWRFRPWTLTHRGWVFHHATRHATRDDETLTKRRVHAGLLPCSHSQPRATGGYLPKLTPSKLQKMTGLREKHRKGGARSTHGRSPAQNGGSPARQLPHIAGAVSPLGRNLPQVNPMPGVRHPIPRYGGASPARGYGRSYGSEVRAEERSPGLGGVSGGRSPLRNSASDSLLRSTHTFRRYQALQ